MKIFRLLLCLLVITSITFSLKHEVLSLSNQHEYDEYIYDYIHNFINDAKKHSYKVGDNIPIYDLFINDDSIVDYRIREDYIFIPVFDGDELIFTLIGNSKQQTITCKYVSKLKEYLESDVPFVVICYNNKTYISNEFGVLLVEDFSKFSSEMDEIKYKDKINHLLSERANVIVKRDLNTLHYQTKSGHMINAPIKQQIDSNSCWAACIASWVQYYFGTYSSCSNVIITVFPSGQSVMQTASQVVSHLEYHFGIEAARSTYIGMNYIRNRISNDKLFMACWTRPGYTGHMTVLCGWESINGKYRYYLMDPDCTQIVSTRLANGNDKPLYQVISGIDFAFTEKIEYEGFAK